MTGALEGTRVLDLSWGIAGPVAGMLLADHGAEVTKIEPPSGDPFRDLSGYRVWSRGKRNAVLDLKDERDLERFRALASQADVLIESFSPGVTSRLGIDADTLAALNPRLVHCSITGYGTGGRDADRPGYDALVAARTGTQWESRGTPGGTISRLAGAAPPLADLEVPPNCRYGPARPGPLFSAVPWTSMATAYLATLAISAGLHARAVTGRGQHVSTSLVQGALATTVFPWQRVEDPDAPHYQSWVIDSRVPKGFYQASDARWVHQWPMLPMFVTGASEGDELVFDAESDAATATRIALDPEEMVLIHHYRDPVAERIARFPADAWDQVAAEANKPLQVVRSPEEALLDPLLLADGCVMELDDPELGPVRQVGTVYELSACPTERPAPPARPGQHTEEVRAEADRIRADAPSGSPAGPVPSPPTPAPPASSAGPLAGITVLDLGLAVAGPFGTQLLSDLGADVIKVNAPTDDYWHRNHLGMSCNRGKRSIKIDLKRPEGLAVLHRLVEGADVVQHNMRYVAAERLGIDYESLRAVNPSLVYCHTRGHERGPRESLPGNDQTAAALTGVGWVEGGLDDGGEPIWPVISLGDTGNGFLSAIAMVQALLHRDRTGEGQFVNTAIVNAHLLNLSSAWVTADGEVRGDRPTLDAELLGSSALHGLYDTADGWLCLAAMTDEHWVSVGRCLDRPELATDGRFASTEARRTNDEALRKELAGCFAQRDAAAWFGILDAAAVPCEVSDPDYVLGLFDDQEMIDRGWVSSFERRDVGRMDVAGLLMDFSATPGRVQGPALVPGLDTFEILAEVGYDEVEVARLLALGAIASSPPVEDR